MSDIQFLRLGQFNAQQIDSLYGELLKVAKQSAIVCDYLIDQIAEVMGIDDRDGRIAIKTSLSDLDMLNEKSREFMAYRLAANATNIRSGRPAVYTPANVHEQMTRCTVRSIVRATGDSSGVSLRLFVMEGPLAGRMVSKKFTFKHCHFLYGYLTANWRSRPELRALVMFLKWRLVISLSWDGVTVDTGKIGVTRGIAEFNVQLVKARLRRYSDCPFDKKHDCINCDVTQKDCGRSMLLSESEK